jgi:hypothetical protein
MFQNVPTGEVIGTSSRPSVYALPGGLRGPVLVEEDGEGNPGHWRPESVFVLTQLNGQSRSWRCLPIRLRGSWAPEYRKRDGDVDTVALVLLELGQPDVGEHQFLYRRKGDAFM